MAVNSDTAMDVAAVATTVGQPEGQWSLDAARSRAEFHVGHFWGAITVHGHFERLQGEGTVRPDGTISGRLVIDAASLTTKNTKRDQHLRSAEFFEVARHPDVVVSVRDLTLTGATALRGRVAVEAAGREQEFEATGTVLEAGPDAATLRCELVFDRTAYGMTWSPLGMASRQVRAMVTARFVRP